MHLTLHLALHLTLHLTPHLTLHLTLKRWQDDEERAHEDQGGCIIVYSVDEQLLTYSPDPSEKDYVPPKIWEAKIASTPIDCLAFSPCGRYLACGSHDMLIQILDVKKGFATCGRCTGHSSTIKTLDWSALQQNATLLMGAFPMFVPSLSW